ncbi:MAG TPA: GNAT family N-acetyltransferase [Acidimicrobiales bacterium]|nr:GNAT family N-acetyltransferase [Acidimicrobiales bacterium]
MSATSRSALDLLTLQRRWVRDPSAPPEGTGDVRLVTADGGWRVVPGSSIPPVEADRLCRDLRASSIAEAEPLAVLDEVQPAMAALGGQVRQIEGGPVYEFGPAWQRSTTTHRVVTSDTVATFLRCPRSWDEDEWSELMAERLGPWAAVVVDGETVSLTHTPRAVLPNAAECGVWTHPDFRGRGLAAAATSAWADLVEAEGRLRFYSTDHRNAASRKVTERLRLRHLGWQWTLSFDDFKQGDGWGRALRDHDRGVWTPMPELEVEDGGVSDAMHPEWFFRRFEQWDWWERQLLPLAAQGPALDLGAGAGRTSLWLQEHGVAVTAVDSSRGAVAVCRDRGVADARLGDLNDPPTDQLWRAVFLLCGNLGLGGTWDGIRRLLRRVAELSAPDAVVVADTVEPRGPAEIGLRIRYKGVATPWWRQHNVPVAAMESLVRDTGWRIDRHLVDAPDHAVLLRKS